MTKHHGDTQGNTIAVVAVGRLQAAVYKLNHAGRYSIKLYLHSLGGESSQSTDSNSSRGNCELISIQLYRANVILRGWGLENGFLCRRGPAGESWKTSSDVIAMTETAETAEMWHKSIRPEDCVQIYLLVLQV